MKKWALTAAILSAALIAFAQVAAAQDADDYRGGWESGPNGGVPQIYEFSIRGNSVRGIYCTHCSDATTLAFVDGKFGPRGITFAVTHVRDDGSTAYLDHATATFDHGRLIVSGTSGAPGGGHFRWLLHKDPRGPDPLVLVPVSRLPKAPPVAPIPLRRGPGPLPPPAPYLQPGPWEQLTPAKVVGVWLGFGAGINKQFFIIRRVGDKLRGMVCGRCDNPYTMTALDDFQIQGDTLKFNILHEDWGDGDIPFYKHVTAHIADNELRAVFTADHPPKEYALFPGGGHVGASLMGPVSIDSTAGND
ncbi:MAG TPA: hypothetical protein VHX52_04195 [Steroidobacteraceae bacterium]|jgi:hypothetical protein|nr:hypothetical protein [Steroidobacteraceae bacterium]